MHFTYSGGTARQHSLTDSAIAACDFPLAAVSVDVTVQWGAVPPGDVMFTTVNSDETFTITIDPSADDPTWAGNQGLLDPVTQVPYLYEENFVHEIGHVISAISFASLVGPGGVTAMCALFTTTDSSGHVRAGTLADFDNAGPWALKIKEAVAECFKCAFYTDTPLIFHNRTKWSIGEANWPAFLSLLEPVDQWYGVKWSFTGDSGADVIFPSPIVVGGRLVHYSAAAGGRLIEVLCGSPAHPVGWSMNWSAFVEGATQLADGTWVTFDTTIDDGFDPGGPVTDCPGGGRTIEIDPSATVGLPSGALAPIISVSADAGVFGTLAPGSLLWQYTVSVAMAVGADSVNAAFDIGYNLHSPFTAVRGVAISGEVGGTPFVSDHADFTGFSPISEDAIQGLVTPLVSRIAVSAPYPFGTQGAALASLGPAGVVAGAKVLALDGASLSPAGTFDSSRVPGVPGPPGSSGATDTKGGVVG